MTFSKQSHSSHHAVAEPLRQTSSGLRPLASAIPCVLAGTWRRDRRVNHVARWPAWRSARAPPPAGPTARAAAEQPGASPARGQAPLAPPLGLLFCCSSSALDYPRETCRQASSSLISPPEGLLECCIRPGNLVGHFWSSVFEPTRGVDGEHTGFQVQRAPASACPGPARSLAARSGGAALRACR